MSSFKLIVNLQNCVLKFLSGRIHGNVVLEEQRNKLV